MSPNSPRTEAIELLKAFPDGTEIKLFETWRGLAEKASIRKIDGGFAIVGGEAHAPEWQELRGRHPEVKRNALNGVRSFAQEGHPTFAIYDEQQDAFRREGFNGFAIRLPRGTKIRSHEVAGLLRNRSVLEAMRNVVAQVHLDGNLEVYGKIRRLGQLANFDGRLGIEGENPSWLPHLDRSAQAPEAAAPRRRRRFASGSEAPKRKEPTIGQPPGAPGNAAAQPSRQAQSSRSAGANQVGASQAGASQVGASQAGQPAQPPPRPSQVDSASAAPKPMTQPLIAPTFRPEKMKP